MLPSGIVFVETLCSSLYVTDKKYDTFILACLHHFTVTIHLILKFAIN